MYDNVTYSSRREATAAIQRDLQTNLDLVRVSDVKVGGSAIVLIPNRDRLRQHGVVTTGRAGSDQVEYIVDMLELSLSSMGEALASSRLFDRVDIIRHPDPASAATSSDWSIIFDLKDPSTGQWYLHRANSLGALPVPLDTGVDRRQRANVWIQAITRAASQLDSTTADETRGSSSTTASGSEPLEPVSSGTGFIVAPGATLVTNQHVTADCSRITTTQEGRDVDLVVVFSDAKNDLAVLKGSVRGSSIVFAAKSARLGTRVVAIGFPLRNLLASGHTVSEGIVSNVSGPRNDVRLLQTSAAVQPGNSGGPLFDENGHVVGVIVGKLDAIRIAAATGDIPQNVNFAIKESVVEDLLDAAGVDYKNSSSGSAISTAEISRLGQYSVVPIDCWQ